MWNPQKLIPSNEGSVCILPTMDVYISGLLAVCRHSQPREDEGCQVSANHFGKVLELLLPRLWANELKTQQTIKLLYNRQHRSHRLIFLMLIIIPETNLCLGLILEVHKKFSASNPEITFVVITKRRWLDGQVSFVINITAFHIQKQPALLPAVSGDVLTWRMLYVMCMSVSLVVASLKQ